MPEQNLHEYKDKKYPAATEELVSMFKLGREEKPALGHAHPEVPEALPQADAPEAMHQSADSLIEGDIQAAKRTNFLPLLKLLLPYAALFVLGVGAYYFFFSKFSLDNLFKRSPKTVQTAKETALTQLEKQNMDAYAKWIKSYYFDVSDAEVLDPEGDNSGNGLTNFQKFMFRLSPKDYDTLGLGRSDTESLANGVNPLTGGKITEEQRKILENYVDMEVAMNRLALANSQGRSNIAGASIWAGLRGSSQNSYFSLGSSRNPAQDNRTFSQPFQSPDSQPASRISGQQTRGQSLSAPATGPAQDTLGINELDVDTGIPGRLEIPSLNINVPIIWTKATKDFTRDLQTGVVHYPGTALPGQLGTAYISGHSSNYAWAKGEYNQVFATLGSLPENTSFKVTVVQKNGKDARLHYVVTHKKEYRPTDQEQFKNTGKSVVALSTCWPVGSTAKRLVVFGEMTQMEKD